MAEELNLEHFDLGTFVDYVYAIKQERDELRAQLHSRQGAGEAVEVVAWRVEFPLGSGAKVYEQRQDWAYQNYGDVTYHVDELMTVAQHQRIMAAAVVSADPVAMKTHGAWDGLDDLADMPDGTKLYTHPADPDAVPVLHRAHDVIAWMACRADICPKDLNRLEQSARELRQLLADSKGLKK